MTALRVDRAVLAPSFPATAFTVRFQQGGGSQSEPTIRGDQQLSQ